uniref:Uncharacterized protein MANES_13G076600 n=1 Tax=Rhizophora mucronata TaxID=61149 RepID=A0A2P2P3T4_RHIMU
MNCLWAPNCMEERMMISVFARFYQFQKMVLATANMK